MIYIYDDKGNFIEQLNYGKSEFKTEWYSDWKNSYLISEIKFDNPIVDKGEIREKTREELIVEGNRELLLDGEYINKGKVLKKEIPDTLINPIWDKEKSIWKEGVTKDYLTEIRKNKIVEYEKLEEEKKLLENSKFSSEDEIKAIIEKMAVIEGYINTLQDKIKAL